jgi:heme A synthase
MQKPPLSHVSDERAESVNFWDGFIHRSFGMSGAILRLLEYLFSERLQKKSEVSKYCYGSPPVLSVE